MGGLFWSLKTTSNDLDPDFDWFSLRLSRFFCPNLGDLQKKEKKRGLHPSWKQVFLVDTRQVLDQFSSPIPLGGAIFVFSAKIGRKSAKYRLFCILFRPMGSSSPPPPTAPLATPLNLIIRNFKISVFMSIMSKKSDIKRRQRFLARFVCSLLSLEKYFAAAVNATIRATAILLRGGGA